MIRTLTKHSNGMIKDESGRPYAISKYGIIGVGRCDEQEATVELSKDKLNSSSVLFRREVVKDGPYMWAKIRRGLVMDDVCQGIIEDMNTLGITPDDPVFFITRRD